MTRTPIATRSQLRIAGPILKSGLWTTVSHASRSTLAMTQDRLYFYPLAINRAIVLSAMGFETTVVGATGSVVRLGIYSSDGAGAPGALLLDAGTVAVDTATGGAVGLKQITGLSLALNPDLYWVGSVAQVATPPTVRSINSTVASVPSSSFIGSTPISQVLQGTVSAGLPNPAVPLALATGNGTPLIAVMPA